MFHPEEMKKKRIGVLLGGLSAEREVSLESGSAVLAALRQLGYQAVAVDVAKNIDEQLRGAQIEVAYIALHGRFGEDGCVQGLLEAMHIPYTDSGVLSSAMAMDKVFTKRMFDAVSLPTAKWAYPATREAVLSLGLPVVIKPRAEGSSVGLTVVHHDEEIEAAIDKAGGADGALAEKYVRGRELSVGVLGYREQAQALGSVEIVPAEGIYDYAAKYTREDTKYIVPAPIPPEVANDIESLALEVHRLLDCSGATRTDFLWDGQSKPVVLEINTIPGMTSHSLLPKIAAHKGISYAALVESILLGATLQGGAGPGAALKVNRDSIVDSKKDSKKK